MPKVLYFINPILFWKEDKVYVSDEPGKLVTTEEGPNYIFNVLPNNVLAMLEESTSETTRPPCIVTLRKRQLP